MSALKKRVKKITPILKKLYPDSKCTLDFKNPLELLIATILAAQCTDARVNIVTKPLFKKYKKAQDFAKANLETLEEEIRSTGFYKNKAKNIISCCTNIVKEHKGKVPQTIEELTNLAGVGRKTANVILGNCFDIPGVVVDTHAKRLSGRIGLTKETDPVKIEHDLMEIVPKKDWTIFSHLMVFHGRNICLARKPKCDECVIKNDCDFGKKQK